MRNNRTVPARRPAHSILFLDGPSPTFAEENIEIAAGLSLTKVHKSFLASLSRQGVPNVSALAGGCKVCIQMHGTDSTDDLMRPDVFHTALILASDVRSQARGHIIIPSASEAEITTGTDLPGRGSILWGHFRGDVTVADVESATRLLSGVEKLQSMEQFSRVGNALLFYRNGYNSDNPDLALVAFTTCLESLFSTAEQELSFRLSLRLATFLADDRAGREELFQESKEVYKIRSKVVHGAAINRDSEAAAIQLVGAIVPQAERLARRTLVKVLEMRIESLFENAGKLNSLFDKLLFSQSLNETLGEIGIKR